MDGKTRTICSGLPTRRANEDHVPSSPSLGHLSVHLVVDVEEAGDANKKRKDMYSFGDYLKYFTYHHWDGGQEIGAGVIPSEP